jgi:hypothetical protein
MSDVSAIWGASLRLGAGIYHGPAGAELALGADVSVLGVALRTDAVDVLLQPVASVRGRHIFDEGRMFATGGAALALTIGASARPARSVAERITGYATGGFSLSDERGLTPRLSAGLGFMLVPRATVSTGVELRLGVEHADGATGASLSIGGAFDLTDAFRAITF